MYDVAPAPVAARRGRRKWVVAAGVGVVAALALGAAVAAHDSGHDSTQLNPSTATTAPANQLTPPTSADPSTGIGRFPGRGNRGGQSSPGSGSASNGAGQSPGTGSSSDGSAGSGSTGSGSDGSSSTGGGSSSGGSSSGGSSSGGATQSPDNGSGSNGATQSPDTGGQLPDFGGQLPQINNEQDLEQIIRDILRQLGIDPSSLLPSGGQGSSGSSANPSSGVN